MRWGRGDVARGRRRRRKPRSGPPRHRLARLVGCRSTRLREHERLPADDDVRGHRVLRGSLRLAPGVPPLRRAARLRERLAVRWRHRVPPVQRPDGLWPDARLRLLLPALRDGRRLPTDADVFVGQLRATHVRRLPGVLLVHQWSLHGPGVHKRYRLPYRPLREQLLRRDARDVHDVARLRIESAGFSPSAELLLAEGMRPFLPFSVQQSAR
jgi:hypothetical protein